MHPIGGLRIASMALLVLLGLCCCAGAAEFNGFDDITGPLVKCHTTAANGAPFLIEVKPDWAPLGADRFLKLVESGYFSQVPFYRVVKGFLTQFGITPDKTLRMYWRKQGPIQDDPNERRAIKRGYLSFAGGGPNTRDMQLFIALADSDWLGKAAWEVPIGRVIYGMEDVIDKLYDVGEIHPFDDKGVKQGKIWEDVEYLHREFPKLDYFTDCKILGPSPLAEEKAGAQQPGADTRAAESATIQAALAAKQKKSAAVAAVAPANADKAGKKNKNPEDGKESPATTTAAAASSSSSSSGRLAAAVEAQIRPESAMWGAGTLCFALGSIALFVLLLYKLGDETAATKGR